MSALSKGSYRTKRILCLTRLLNDGIIPDGTKNSPKSTCGTSVDEFTKAETESSACPSMSYKGNFDGGSSVSSIVSRHLPALNCISDECSEASSKPIAFISPVKRPPSALVLSGSHSLVCSGPLEVSSAIFLNPFFVSSQCFI